MYISENDNTKLLFSGKTTDDKMLCIKFVCHYSREVHERCASAGYALALYGFENLSGRWHMIIMEIITEDYCWWNFLSSWRNYCESGISSSNYVHVDIRNTNVTVKKDGSLGIKLVDFDWSGKISEVHKFYTTAAGLLFKIQSHTLTEMFYHRNK